jgi:hypothetical protein
VRASRGALFGTGPIAIGKRARIVMGRPTHLFGVVSVKASPAKFTTVVATERSQFIPVRSTTTDANGRYALDLPPGTWSLSADGVALGRVARLDGPTKKVDLGDEFEGKCSVAFKRRPHKMEFESADGNGFIVDGLAPGERISAPCGDYELHGIMFMPVTGREKVFVHIGGNETIDLRFTELEWPLDLLDLP